MVYKEKVEVTKKECEEWNALLEKTLDEMTEEEIEKYGAKADDGRGGFWIDFENGSHITIDLYSGSSNYYDDRVWVSADGKKDVTFDCSYELAREKTDEYTVGEDTYIIEWEIVEEEAA